MRLQIKIAAAAMMGVIVAVGLSMVAAPADEVASEFRRAAATAITSVEHVRVIGERLKDNLATELLMWDLARPSHRVSTVDGESRRSAVETAGSLSR